MQNILKACATVSLYLQDYHQFHHLLTGAVWYDWTKIHEGWQRASKVGNSFLVRSIKVRILQPWIKSNMKPRTAHGWWAGIESALKSWEDQSQQGAVQAKRWACREGLLATRCHGCVRGNWACQWVRNTLQEGKYTKDIFVSRVSWGCRWLEAVGRDVICLSCYSALLQSFVIDLWALVSIQEISLFVFIKY